MFFAKYGSRKKNLCAPFFSPQHWSHAKSSSNSKTRCFVLCSTRSGLSSCPRCQISRSMNKTEPSLRMRRTVERRVPYKSWDLAEAWVVIWAGGKASDVLGALTEIVVTAVMGVSRGVRISLASLLCVASEMGVTWIVSRSWARSFIGSGGCQLCQTMVKEIQKSRSQRERLKHTRECRRASPPAGFQNPGRYSESNSSKHHQNWILLSSLSATRFLPCHQYHLKYNRRPVLRVWVDEPAEGRPHHDWSLILHHKIASYPVSAL